MIRRVERCCFGASLFRESFSKAKVEWSVLSDYEDLPEDCKREEVKGSRLLESHADRINVERNSNGQDNDEMAGRLRANHD